MLSGLVRPGRSISLSRCVSSPGSLLTNQHRLELKMPDADPFAVLDAKAWVSAGLAPSGGSQRGPFLPLPAAGGSRRPSAGDTPLPPLPPFTWLFLHTSVCLLLCLSSSPVTLLTAGPPPARPRLERLTCITCAKALIPNKAAPPPPGHETHRIPGQPTAATGQPG